MLFDNFDNSLRLEGEQHVHFLAPQGRHRVVLRFRDNKAQSDADRNHREPEPDENLEINKSHLDRLRRTPRGGIRAHVTDSSDRFYPFGTIGKEAYFSAQMADMQINAAVHWGKRPAESVLGQLFSGDDLSGASQEHSQEIELCSR